MSWRAAFAACLFLFSAAAAAQEWPARPLHIIVGFAPGSTPDIMARMLSERLAQRLGKPVIVDNKPGAAGNIGADAVAKAAPDGYTFGLTISGPLAANGLLFRHLPYNPQTDFEPVSIVATQPSVLVTTPQTGIADMPGLLAKLKSEPGKFNYASMGNGSISHLAMAAIAARSGTEIVHVPYASSGQAVSSLLAGDTQLAVLPAGAAVAQIKAGKLKPLAVATARRSPLLPGLPTLAESGLQDVQADAWMGMIAPAKTPPAIVNRMQAEVAAIVKSEDLRPKLQAQLMEPVASSPAEMRATLQADLARWRPVIQRYRISLD